MLLSDVKTAVPVAAPNNSWLLLLFVHLRTTVQCALRAMAAQYVKSVSTGITLTEEV